MEIKTLWQNVDDVIELAVAVDEFMDESNPEYWILECEKARNQHPGAECRTIILKLPWKRIGDAFKAVEIKV